MPFASISLTDLLLCAFAGFGASIIGGLAGYGTGLLMPIVLVPIVGAEAVVPIIGVMAMFTNAGRISAFWRHTDLKLAGMIVAIAAPCAVIGALFFAWLSGRGALIVIGLALLATIPARRILKTRNWTLGTRQLAFGAALYGVLAGGTTGSGVLLVAMLTASGMLPVAVVATDAVISLITGAIKTATFWSAGALDLETFIFACIIGLATFPGGFVARLLVDRLSLKVHAVLLDGAVIVGALVILWRALRM